MKKAKKLMAVLLAMSVIFAMSLTSFADDGDITVTVPDDGHAYSIYQIMTGDVNAAGDKLSNAKWGDNAVTSKTGSVSDEDMKTLTDLNGKSDTIKLATIKGFVDFNSQAKASIAANSTTRTADVAPGYYLVVDNGPAAEEDAISLYIVQVIGKTTIEPKKGTTTSDKKVDDVNDSTTEENAINWQDSADYDIGDAVPFKLSATICEDYANYTNGYKLTFHDKECDGLSFNKESVKVYVDGKILNNPEEGDAYYTVIVPENEEDCSFEVSFGDLTKINAVKAESVISVEYTSTLNEKANIGQTGNVNKSYVTYTNNPNDEQAGENGKTPEDQVIVFTYKVVVNKLDGSNQPLPNAEFTLLKELANGETATIAVVKDTAGTVFTFKGLDDGKYILKETKTPDGYNSIPDQKFTVAATHTNDEGTDPLKLTALTGSTTSGSIEFTPVLAEGSLNTNVVNQSGAVLPSTGGIGTTLFYVFGAILVLGAAILLITRRRVNASK